MIHPCTVTVIAERQVRGLLTLEDQQLSGWIINKVEEWM